MNDKVAMHYDISGNVDRYGSKYENFILPVSIIVITIFWLIFIWHYEKKAKSAVQEKEREEAKSNAKVLYFVAGGMTVMFGIMQCFFLYGNLVQDRDNLNYLPFDINVVINVLLGILLIVMGNYLPKTKLNSTVGVRTPWSMKNDIVWAKSNRFGGMAGVFSGALIILQALLIKGIASTMLTVGIIALFAIISTIYSYYIYKNLETKN